MLAHLRKYIQAAGGAAPPGKAAPGRPPPPPPQQSAIDRLLLQQRLPDTSVAARTAKRVLLQVDGTPGTGGGGRAGVSAIVRDERGHVLRWGCALAPARTNNEAEYQAVLFGLRLVAHDFPGCTVRLLTDSLVVVDQLTGRCAVRNERMQALHSEAAALCARLGRVEFAHIPRELNQLADALAWEALGGAALLLRAAQVRVKATDAAPHNAGRGSVEQMDNRKAAR